MDAGTAGVVLVSDFVGNHDRLETLDPPAVWPGPNVNVLPDVEDEAIAFVHLADVQRDLSGRWVKNQNADVVSGRARIFSRTH
jgi:hypothetical protein